MLPNIILSKVYTEKSYNKGEFHNCLEIPDFPETPSTLQVAVCVYYMYCCKIYCTPIEV